MAVLRFNSRSVLLVVLLLVLLPSVFAISFISGPSVNSGGNQTTEDLFRCAFTPDGGVLSANITWYRDGSLWSADDQDTTYVSDGVLANSVVVDTSNTARGQSWVCRVTLNNISHSISQNSSMIYIENALPKITQIANQTVDEDTPRTWQMSATDPDLDTLSWWVSSGVFPFSINNSGYISLLYTNEDYVGNHTVKIGVDDTYAGNYISVTFEVVPVNDAPVFNIASLTANCLELGLCDPAVLATDEDNISLIFTTNEAFINMSTSGVLNFIPTAVHVGNHLIPINVSDGLSIIQGILNLTINGTNHVPTFNFNSSLTSFAMQNQSNNFTFTINATDIDAVDILSFSIDSLCPLSNPWSINLIANGSGSTNASAQINLNLTNNNDYVVCRDVNITVTDGSLSSSTIFTLNITNTNDAPSIYNGSYYSENVISEQFSNTDMSNISAAKGLAFSFRVNATDIDNLTYAGESINFSLNGHNPLLYKINSTTGLITSIASLMNDSYIGNISFFVNVTDDENLSTFALVNISIINNSIPVLAPINDSDCIEGVLCSKDFVADDAEASNLTLTLNSQFISFDNVTHYYNHLETVSLLNVSFDSFVGITTTYSMQLYSDDLHVGNYTLNVTFTDNYAAFDMQQINFSIFNVNDIPYLGDNYSATILDNLTFPITAELLSFSKILYGVDGDTYYGQENLTFNYSFISGNLTTINLTKLNVSAASLTFTPSLADAGNYSLNLTVIDSTGNFSSSIVNFTVYDSVDAPTITQIRPHLNGSNETVESFTATLGVNNTSMIYVDENNDLLFDILAIDNDNLSIVASWYENGLLQSSNLPLLGDSFYYRQFGFADSGLFNITVYVTDRGITSYTWLVSVSDINQPPLFLNNLSSLNGSSGIIGPQVFDDFFRLTSPDRIVFLDGDDDTNNNSYIDIIENNTLVFSFNDSTSCDSFADFSFNESKLTITPSVIGSCNASFYATDLYNLSVSSNEIRIDIWDLGKSTVQTTVSTSSGSKTVTRTVTVPIDNEVPTSVRFVYPGISSLYADGTVVIPYTFTNTWDNDVSDIDLTFNSSISELNGVLSITRIESLASGASVSFNLTYENYRFEAPFEVNLTASVGSLEYIDTATVFINALEKGTYSENAVKTRIGFARDLLSDNSECQELNEILENADNQDDVQASLTLINSVINGCKYLINAQRTPTNEVPLSATGRLSVFTDEYVDYRLLVTMIIGMVLAAIVIGIFSKFKLKKI